MNIASHALMHCGDTSADGDGDDLSASAQRIDLCIFTCSFVLLRHTPPCSSSDEDDRIMYVYTVCRPTTGSRAQTTP